MLAGQRSWSRRLTRAAGGTARNASAAPQVRGNKVFVKFV